mgnify:CR=1 FL=1
MRLIVCLFVCLHVRENVRMVTKKKQRWGGRGFVFVCLKSPRHFLIFVNVYVRIIRNVCFAFRGKERGDEVCKLFKRK